ncbi:hypothetical protein [Lentzea sp. NPDC004782]|uniref:hypothetical protein n=1 Tax=Lentzea sp. NPDC004782 TaxID=3154458 RepID=UPI0033B20E49
MLSTTLHNHGRKVLAVLGAVPLLLAMAVQAQAGPVTPTSLAGCSAHYANTAAWMDCTGGSEKSWVRLGYNCGIPPITRDHHTKWYSLDPWASITVSAECNVRVNGAWANIRKY